jgi:hypothetical protein
VPDFKTKIAMDSNLQPEQLDDMNNDRLQNSRSLSASQQSTIPSTRKIFGLLGVLMCLTAFVVALAGSIFISVSYTLEFQTGCGWIACSLRASSVVYGIIIGGIGFGGRVLASKGGFTSRWWRFFCNMTVGLCAFTIFYTLFLDDIIFHTAA